MNMLITNTMTASFALTFRHCSIQQPTGIDSENTKAAQVFVLIVISKLFDLKVKIFKFAQAKEKHSMRYTFLLGFNRERNWVRLKFAAMNLKKLAVWAW